MACDSSRVQDQSSYKSAIPEGAIGGERGVDREGTKAARVFQADIKWGGDGVEGSRGRGEVGRGVDESGLEGGGSAGEKEATVIWLVGGFNSAVLGGMGQ